MADIGVKTTWLVKEDFEVNKKWLQVQIQERVSRINRAKQDIEDLKKGQIVKLEGHIMMLEKELRHLQDKLKQGQPIDVDVKED